MIRITSKWFFGKSLKDVFIDILFLCVYTGFRAMPQKTIPTRVITIGKDTPYERNVTVYEWLTQKEENEYMRRLTGDKDYEIKEKENKRPGDEDDTEVKMSVKIGDVGDALVYLIECQCVDLTVQEFDVMSPSLRKDLEDQLKSIEKEYKKK